MLFVCFFVLFFICCFFVEKRTTNAFISQPRERYFSTVTFSPQGRTSCWQLCPGCPWKILWVIWLVIWRLLCVSWSTWSSFVSSEREIRLFRVCEITFDNFKQFQKPQPWNILLKCSLKVGNLNCTFVNFNVAVCYWVTNRNLFYIFGFILMKGLMSHTRLHKNMHLPVRGKAYPYVAK